MSRLSVLRAYSSENTHQLVSLMHTERYVRYNLQEHFLEQIAVPRRCNGMMRPCEVVRMAGGPRGEKGSDRGYRAEEVGGRSLVPIPGRVLCDRVW